jgi:hypothetical protein
VHSLINWIQIALVVCVTTYSSNGQAVKPDEKSRLHFYVSGAAGVNYHLTYPDVFLSCIYDDCPTDYQRPGIGYGFSADLTYQAVSDNYIVSSIGYSRHRYSDFSLVSLGAGFGDPSKTNLSFGFISVGMGYGLKRKKTYFDNQLIVDLNVPRNNLVRSAGLSYQLKCRFQEFSTTTSNFLFEPFIKVAVSNYFRNKEIIYTDVESTKYFPFSLGVRVTLHFVRNESWK